MNVCSKCFADPELKGFISSFNNKGLCTFCGEQNEYVIDIKELLDFFQELFDNFTTANSGPSLPELLQMEWGVFSSFEISKKILDQIISQVDTDISSTSISVNYIDDIVENYSHWVDLKVNLKWSNRFISDIGLLEEYGWDGFFNTQYQLDNSVDLYRARVHHESGLSPYKESDMMCPKKEKTRGGRANPLGIPYLYLCDNPDTVLYEVRASYLDEISVGRFRVSKNKSPLKIVDFTEKTSLFRPEGNVNEIIKAKLLRDIISRDLSKPMRRYDSEIEYIPTQFICEFIRVFTGAMGIRFRSSLHPEGKNIVIFDQELMECVGVDLKRVDKLNLSANNIK